MVGAMRPLLRVLSRDTLSQREPGSGRAGRQHEAVAP